MASKKLSRTIKVKIGKISNRKHKTLDSLISKSINAINFCLKKAKEGNKITHKLVYKDLRKLDLPATVIHSCRAKSIEIIKCYIKHKGKKKFPILKYGSVRFDNQIIKLRKTDNILYKYFVSLLYKAGQRGKSDNRIELPLLVNSEYQTQILSQIGSGYKIGSTELVKRDDDFYIHISYSKEVELPTPNSSFSPVGVDIGINNLAVSVAQSSVVFHNGERVSWKNEFFRKQRSLYQRNFAVQKFFELKDKQTRYNDFYLHNIAKSIVEQAKKENKPVIVLEDLTHILDTSKVSRSQRYKHHSWVFRRLQSAIEYKANWEGIPVVHINPRHSSQICSKCGELNKRNRHTYKCGKCGFEANADYNAGRNLQKLFLATCQGEQASINNAFDSVIPEPQATKDNNVENNSISPMSKNMGILEVFYGV